MFDSKKERYAYVQGLRAGNRGVKPYPPKQQKGKKKPFQSRLGSSFDAEDFYQAAVDRSFRKMNETNKK